MGNASSSIDWRSAAADPACRVVWPDSFGTRFTVFVDVEEEFDWRAPLDRAARSTTAIAALPDAHRRFADRGVGLTCLVDHPIANDARAMAVLAAIVADGRSEIGTQLHPWVNPPFEEAISPANSYAGNLPPALEAAKLDVLTDLITAGTGRRPRVYRAGRYGIGPVTLASLASRGYAIDSSIRSAYDYSADGGPDFTGIGPHVFHAGPILELPLTTVFTGRLRSGGAKLYRALGKVPKARGLFARAGLLNRVSLSPEGMPIGEALVAIDAAIADGVRLLGFSFHSPSLVPGHTPYVRDAADLARFHGWWRVMFDHLEKRGVASVSIEEIMVATRGVVGPAGLEPAT